MKLGTRACTDELNRWSEVQSPILASYVVTSANIHVHWAIEDQIWRKGL